MKYNLQQLNEAIKNSKSIRQTLSKLGICEHGGNYATIKRMIKKYNIDTSHFTGKGWNKGQNFGPKRPISDYLSNTRPITSDRLKKRLLKEDYFDYKCYKCHRTLWNEKPIPLELEHINGNHDDNSLSNLTLLCPNCHAQTTTYRRRKN